MNKQLILNTFIDTVKDLPVQGSELWKLNRLKCIGGSEVSTIIKQNKNKTINKLILEKLGHEVFNGNAITYWGNIFEELIRQSSNRRFNCRIVETGSIKYEKDYLSYSPDGLATVSKEALSRYIDFSEYELEDHDSYLTLFEFKCPHSRMPTEDVPVYYLPQVKIGMNIINFLEVGLFIQAVYRRCTIDDIKYNTMHTSQGHFNRTKIQGNPLEYGYMALHTNDTELYQYLDDYLQSVNTKTYNGVYDIGTLYNKEAFEYLLENCVNKNISIDYCYNKEYNQDVFNDLAYAKCMYNISLQRQVKKDINRTKQKYKETLVGIIPYKLMDLYITPIKKCNNYINDNNIWETAKKIISFVGDNHNKSKKEVVALLKKEKF